MFDIFLRRNVADRRYGLIKLYVNVCTANCDFLIKELVGLYDLIAHGQPGVYSLNYGAEKKYIEADLIVEGHSLKQGKFENLIIVTNDESVRISAAVINVVDRCFCEVVIVFPDSDKLSSLFLKSSSIIANNIDVLYGYGRELSLDYEPLTEKKRKKSLFGSSVAVEPFIKGWLIRPSISSPVIKGIYRLNLIREDILQNSYFSCCLNTEKKPIALGSKYIIVECDPLELMEIKKSDKDISQYVTY